MFDDIIATNEFLDRYEAQLANGTSESKPTSSTRDFKTESNRLSLPEPSADDQKAPSRTNELTTLDYAKLYLKMGLSVIPIRRIEGNIDASKRPSIGWKEYQKRQPTQDEISGWFDGIQSNIAIATGVNDVAVLDFDDIEVFKKWATEHKKWLGESGFNVPIVSTGKGYHIYVKMPEHKTAKLYFNGELAGDIKAAGGYVVAPPSIHGSGRRYEWISPPETPLPFVADLSEIGLNDGQTPKRYKNA